MFSYIEYSCNFYNSFNKYCNLIFYIYNVKLILLYILLIMLYYNYDNTLFPYNFF